MFNSTNNLSTTTDIDGQAIIKIILGSSAPVGTVYKYYMNETSGSVVAGNKGVPEIALFSLILLLYLSILTGKGRKLI